MHSSLSLSLCVCVCVCLSVCLSVSLSLSLPLSLSLSLSASLSASLYACVLGFPQNGLPEAQILSAPVSSGAQDPQTTPAPDAESDSEAKASVQSYVTIIIVLITLIVIAVASAAVYYAYYCRNRTQSNAELKSPMLSGVHEEAPAEVLPLSNRQDDSAGAPDGEPLHEAEVVKSSNCLMSIIVNP